jgi:hypothetical protein
MEPIRSIELPIPEVKPPTRILATWSTGDGLKYALVFLHTSSEETGSGVLIALVDTIERARDYLKSTPEASRHRYTVFNIVTGEEVDVRGYR